MARIKFTKSAISTLAPPHKGERLTVYDLEIPKLALRVTPAGAKTFYVIKRSGASMVWVKLGSFPDMTVEQARNAAQLALADFASGHNPAAIKRAAREKIRQEKIPALEAWNAYLAARRPRWGDRTYLDHQRMSDPGGKPKIRGRKRGEPETTQPGALYPLLLLPLQQIDGDKVASWLADEAKRRPTQARLAFGILRAFLNWCTSHPDYRDQAHGDACAGRRTRDEVPRVAPKTDCLQREQLSLWFEHVRALPNPVPSAYLQALLLTGARREELLGLRWEDVDFQWKSLTIRDKVEGERTIPLTPYVGALLAALPRRNGWVFSSPTAESGRLQEPRTPHNKALVAAGLPELTLHGLRRSFGTLAEWVECPAGISAQIMGHKPSALAEKHYRRRPLDLLRKWHTKIEGWILEQAGIGQQTQADGAPGMPAVQRAPKVTTA